MVETSAGVGSVERDRNLYHLKHHSNLGMPGQSALTPQGRADPHSSRGRFAEKYGLISQDLAQLPGEARRIGAVGMSEWEVRTPRDEQQRATQYVETGKFEGQKRVNQCLSSRPLRFTKGQSQIGTESLYPKNLRPGIEAPMRNMKHPAEGGLRPLKKILSINTDGSQPSSKKMVAV